MKNFNKISLSMFLILLLFTYGENKKLSPVSPKNSICNTSIGKSLVTINSNNIFSDDRYNIMTSVGLIINCKHKIVVANSKYASKYTEISITLPTGEKYKAKSVYDNLLLSFSLLKIETDEAILCKQIKLPNRHSPSIIKDNKVTMYGLKNEGNFVYQSGKILATNSNFSVRYGSLYKIKYSYTKNEIDNLIPYNQINELFAVISQDTNEIIGINIVNNILDKYSLAINIEYVKYALKAYVLHSNKPIIETGEIGVSLQPISIKSASLLYNYSKNQCGDGISFLIVTDVIKNYNSDQLLFPNDILVSINNIQTYDDVKIVDRILNSNIGKEIEVTVCRNGISITEKIVVNNSQAYFNDKLFKMNEKNIIFREVDLISKYQHNMYDMKGILMDLEPKSGCNISYLEQNNQLSILINKVDGKEIQNIREFINLILYNCGNNSLLSGFDLKRHKTIVYNLKWKDLKKGMKAFDYDFLKNEWIIKNFNIIAECKKYNF